MALGGYQFQTLVKVLTVMLFAVLGTRHESLVMLIVYLRCGECAEVLFFLNPKGRRCR